MDRDIPNSEPRRGGGRFWWLGRVAIAIFAFVVIAGVVFWFSRERIAGNLIDDALAASELEAAYDIVSIGPQRQIIENFVIGDEARPDLTIERIVAEIDYGLGAPQIGRITTINPRVYGTLQDGVLSFGALDPAIFGDGEGGIPALDVAIVNARGLIEGDYGKIALKLDGEGILDDGFAGKLAATAPGFGTDGCAADKATLYGDLKISAGLPEFAGPLRLRGVSCEGISLASADIATKLSTADGFAKHECGFVIDAQKLGYQGVSGRALNGTAQLVLDGEGANLAHDLAVETLNTPYGGLQAVTADGSVRSSFESGDTEWSADVRGQSFTPGTTANALVADAKAGLEGTMLQPLLTKLTRNLDAQTKGASLAANVTVRQSGSGLAIIVPEGRVVSATGTPLLALSRLSWSPGGSARAGSLTGNFITGGAGLPKINGRMEQRGRGALTVRMAMAEYADGPNRIAVPRFELRQSRGGTARFTGMVNASGDIPGGSVNRLILPLSGTISPQGGLALGEECLTARFDALALYDLSLQAQKLNLCPDEGARAMLIYRDTLSVAAATQALELQGELAGTPITLTSSGGAMRYPAPFELRDVAVRIGDPENGMDLIAASLTGDFASNEDGAAARGTFMGASAGIDAVPLNFAQIAGNWRYRDDGLLVVDEAALTVSERTAEEPRFYPLVAQGAFLTLQDGDIRAEADLRHPGSRQLITAVTMAHDLGNGAGQAVLDVPGVTFGEGLEPDDLTYLTEGAIAFANGTVAGRGQINWDAQNITSGGTFSTSDFDLAAAFGPVEGLNGEIVFTDLLALTTAPDQEITIASVNPGIEVLAGKIVYSLTNGEIVGVKDGRWPFMGGELILQPTQLAYGGTGKQQFVFEIVGLDAAKFVSQLELTNLSATGLFDGTIPVVFDADGNGQINSGLLISRAPGGNIAYVGELTYEDLGAMGNYAFQSLRSLDYTQMSIGLNGDLAGEIITNMTFDGVSQGEGADSNFITRRLAKLPIRFNVNVRAENFYELATMVRSFWDPAFVGDPANRGSLPGSGGRLQVLNPNNNDAPAGPQPVLPDIRRPDEPAVQAGESEDSL